METFEIIVKNNSYKVIRDNDNHQVYSVFNHAVYYLIQKNNFGVWEALEHRFGDGELSVAEVGAQIDDYYDYLAYSALMKSVGG